MGMSLDTIRKITIQGEGQASLNSLQQSLDKVTASERGLATASGATATVTDIATKRQLSAADAYRRQSLVVVEGARAQAQLAAAIKVADSALQQGIITASDHAVRIGQIQQKYGEATTATRGLTAATGGLTSALDLAKGAMAAFGLTLGLAAMVSYGKSVFDTTADLQEQADQILGAGGNVEALQALRGIFLQNGISMEAGDKIVTRLTRSLGEAEEGSKAAQDAFKKLQLGADELGGKDGATALPLVAKGLLGIKDASERATVEVALFSRQGQQLESALGALQSPIDELIARAKSLGIVIDKDMIKKADDAKDAMALSWMKLAVAVAPIVTDWVEGFTKITSSIDGSTTALEGMVRKVQVLAGIYAGAKIGGLFGGAGAVAGGIAGGVGVMAYQGPTQGQLSSSVDRYNAQLQGNGLSPSERADIQARRDRALQQFNDGVPYQGLVQTGGPAKSAPEVSGKTWKPTKEDLDAYNKIKETYADFLIELKQGAEIAGLTTAEQQDQTTIIKAAQIYQAENKVADRDRVRSYQEAADLLSRHGLLQGVVNTLDKTHESFLARQNASAQDNLDILNLQISLVGKSNVEQARAVALLKEQQTLKQQYGEGFDPSHPTDEQSNAIKLAQDLAEANVKLTETQDSYNSSLSTTSDLMAEMAGNAQDAAKGMADGFGKVGKTIGDVVAAQAVYNARQADFAVQREQINKSGVDVANRLSLLTQKQANVEDQYYSDSIDGLKNMFGEKTAAYRVLSAIEGTYNALRLAGNIEAMISDAAGVAAKVATVPVHVAANERSPRAGVAAGAGQIFAELGPWGFPVVAAMIGGDAGLGFSGGGGSSAPAVDIAKQRQSQQGAGTVLGDASAKSDSIAKSLDQLTKTPTPTWNTATRW
jgi:hypothetical protein